MNKKEKILVAMSGGIDSSVAALLLQQQGYDLVGITMNLYSCSNPSIKSCCSAKDRLDAANVCKQLDIPFIVIDYQKEFNEKIIEPFVDDYLNAKTPSPCILCNKYFKFGALYQEMKRLGCKYVATGHYANIKNDLRYKLFRGIELKKDQSYFLFVLSEKDLAQTLFPLGKYTKEEIRKIAVDNNLPVQNKKESQEICFVTNNDYVSFIESYYGNKLKGSGNFVNLKGEILGKHKGIHAYTIGQRRGLGFGIGERQYVVKINVDKNEIILGKKEDLYKKRMLVKNLNWICSKKELEQKNMNILVQLRSTHKAAKAYLNFISENVLEVIFESPQEMISPGQAAVFYNDHEVLGGGWIDHE